MKELDFAFIGQRIKDIRTEKKYTQEYLLIQSGLKAPRHPSFAVNVFSMTDS